MKFKYQISPPKSAGGGVDVVDEVIVEYVPGNSDLTTHYKRIKLPAFKDPKELHDYLQVHAPIQQWKYELYGHLITEMILEESDAVHESEEVDI